jgi:hypothetical protein
MHNVAFKLAAIAVLAMSFAGTASAQTNWNARHPWRHEANEHDALIRRLETNSSQCFWLGTVWGRKPSVESCALSKVGRPQTCWRGT